MFKRGKKYMSQHLEFNAVVHALGGIGLGILLTHLAFDPHPVRWAAFFILLAIAGHLYAMKK